MFYDYCERNTKLEVGVALNVVTHLSRVLGFHATDHMGREELIDASDNIDFGTSKYPLIITKVQAGRLKSGLAEAKEVEG